MLARHAFELAAAHATLKPPDDHWAFLEDIDAPKWVDLTLEAALEGCEGDDPWFHTSHWHHETPLLHLVDLVSPPPPPTPRPLQKKKSAVSAPKVSKAPAEGLRGEARERQKLTNGRSSKRVQPLCLNEDSDSERPCSTTESAVLGTGFNSTSKEGSSESFNPGNRFYLSPAPAAKVSLESVGSSTSLTQVRRKYFGISEVYDSQPSVCRDDDLNVKLSGGDLPDSSCTSASFAVEKTEELAQGATHASALEFQGLELPEPIPDDFSPFDRKTIPDWSAQISVALKLNASNRLRKSWGGALRVKQDEHLEVPDESLHVLVDGAGTQAGDGFGFVPDAGGQVEGVVSCPRAEPLKSSRLRKSWGGALRVKQDDNLEVPDESLHMLVDGEETQAGDRFDFVSDVGVQLGVVSCPRVEPLQSNRLRKSWGGALRVKQDDIVELPAVEAGDDSRFDRLDMAVKDDRTLAQAGERFHPMEDADPATVGWQGEGNGSCQGDETFKAFPLWKGWGGALRVKQEQNVDHPAVEAADDSRTNRLDMDEAGEISQQEENYDLSMESGCSSMSVARGGHESCVRIAGPCKEEGISRRSTLPHVGGTSGGQRTCSGSSTVCNSALGSSSESFKSTNVAGKGLGRCFRSSGPAGLTDGEPGNGHVVSTAKLRKPLKAQTKAQAGAHAKDAGKGRPPKGNKENLGLETVSKPQQIAHVTTKPRTTLDRPKQHQKEVLRMSMPVFQHKEAVRRSVDPAAKRPVFVGDRSKTRHDAAVPRPSRMGPTLSNHPPSKRVVAISNGPAFRRSVCALPSEGSKKAIPGVNRSTKALGNIGIRASVSQEKGSDLAALIAEHNRKVRPVPQYEPRLHSLRDIREWERRTGQKYYSLPAAERAKVNQELSAQKGAA